jgi:2-polyprenyl-3-methyl-5-hydroxy-6-metoxy-1,4-benzoquinol methylase
MSVETKVRDHFHADAGRFDAIYEDAGKGRFARWVDRVWRGVVRRRLDLSLEVLAPLEGKTILDVGCGSGRFCVAFALKGASRVVGIDFAPRMIELANELAARNGVAGRCEFVTGAFPEVAPPGPYDASTALGFFDYVADPVPIVAKMVDMTHGPAMMSFPKKWEWRIPIRRLRFWRLGCPLYLYTERQVRELLARAGVKNYQWISLDRDYIVVARP